jgi:TRAP-type C4-dicarboxylate transport system substrate-binding protein
MWKTFKPYVMLILVFLVVVSIMVGGCAKQAATPAPGTVYKLTYALFQPPTAALSATNTAFAKEIETRSNGRVQITVAQGGSLLAAPAMYQGIRDGIADMGNGISSYNPGNFPFTSIAELPNAGGSGWAASYAQYDFLMKYQPKEWNDVHILTICSPDCDIMAVGTGKAPILKLEDWKGKAIRTNHADIATALGGTVKDVPMADVFDGISKGVLDGVQGSPEPFKSWKLGDVCKYITLDLAPTQPSILWYNIMNKNKWNSLPSDIQKIITDVSKEYSGKLGLTWDEQAAAGAAYCKSIGDSVYVLPDSEAARWTAAITPVIDARLQKLTTKGFTQKEIQDAWKYFQGRIEYWNGQQSKNNVTPLRDRLQSVIK